MLRLRSPECINAFIKAEYCSQENCSCLDIFPTIERKKKTPNIYRQGQFRDDSHIKARLLFLFRILKVREIRSDFNGGNDEGTVEYPRFTLEGRSSIYVDESSNFHFLRLFEDFSVQFESHEDLRAENMLLFNAFLDQFEEIVYSEYGTFAGEYTVSGIVRWDILEGTIAMTGTEYDELALTDEYAEEYDRLEEEWRKELHEKIKDKMAEELDGLSSSYEYHEKYESKNVGSEFNFKEEVDEMMHQFEAKNSGRE